MAGNAVSLAADVQRVTKAALGNLPYLVLTAPVLYGQNGVESFAYYALNRPRGWVVLHTPRMIGPRALFGRWTVTLEAVAPTLAAAQEVARVLAERLHSMPRNPTAFTFEGDNPAGRASGQDGYKFTLTFVATIRHGE